MQAIAPITHLDAMGVERADPHGLRVRTISSGKRPGQPIPATIPNPLAFGYQAIAPDVQQFLRLESYSSRPIRGDLSNRMRPVVFQDATLASVSQPPSAVNVDRVLTEISEDGQTGGHETRLGICLDDAWSASVDNWLADMFSAGI